MSRVEFGDGGIGSGKFGEHDGRMKIRVGVALNGLLLMRESGGRRVQRFKERRVEVSPERLRAKEPGASAETRVQIGSACRRRSQHRVEVRSGVSRPRERSKSGAGGSVSLTLRREETGSGSL